VDVRGGITVTSTARERVFDVIADDPYAYEIVVDCPNCEAPLDADLVEHQGRP